MRLIDVLEARRNPVLNPRITPVEFIAQYKDDPQAYLHTGSINKVGVYPKSSDGHDSPIGIYAFQIADIWKLYLERAYNEKKRTLPLLPYHGGDHLFILHSDIPTDFPGTYSETDLERDIQGIKKMFGLDDNGIKRLKSAARTNPNFTDIPAGYLWGITKALAAGGVSELDDYTWVDTKRWNAILRGLGHNGFNDPGRGVIHGAEPTQTLFLASSAYSIIDHMKMNNRPKDVKIGDQTYKGGHIPKHFHVKGFDSVFFHNHEPTDLLQVRTWEVDSMSYHDFGNLKRFMAPNSSAVIHLLGGFEGSYDKRANYDVQFVQKTTVPPNITIENMYVGGGQPVLFIKKMPEDFPCQTITISRFADDYGLDKLPDTIKGKIQRK